MVASFFDAPGGTVRYAEGESTTWSIETPSSRCWMRIVWIPVDAKYKGGAKLP